MVWEVSGQKVVTRLTGHTALVVSGHSPSYLRQEMKYWGGGEGAVEEISTGEGARQIFGFGFDAMSCVPCHGFIFATHWYCTVPVSVWASSGHTFCEFSSAFVTNAHVFVSHFSETFFTQKSYLCWCLVDLIAQCVSGITSNRSQGADGKCHHDIAQEAAFHTIIPPVLSSQATKPSVNHCRYFL